MVRHMKTTIDLSDALLEEAKRVAAARSTTVKSLVEAGLRRELRELSTPAVFRLRDGSFEGEGLRSGIEEGTWGRVRELIYEGRGA